jgi:tRNA pseudouridine13 synthase
LEIWGEWAEALEHSGLQQSRRAFLVQPQSMQYKFIKADVMALNFALPSGVYATALLREITKLFRPQNLAL